MFVRFPSFPIMIIYSIDEYYRTIDDHIILPYENQQKSNICTLRGSRSALLLAHIHMYTYVYEYVCMSIFELAYLTNYDYWSNIVRSLSVVKYRFFSRDLLYARATVFFMIQYIIYFFFIIYTSFHFFFIH